MFQDAPWLKYQQQTAPQSPFGGRPVIQGPPPMATPQTPEVREKTIVDTQKSRIEAEKAARDLAKAQQDQAQALQDKAAKKQAALDATRNLVQSLERARGLVSNWSTGLGGRVGQMYPGSDQANQLDTVINQEIRGNIFKNWVDTMKAQTDTGTTGIGRIMQSEIPLVTGSLGALDPIKMGKDGTLQSLDQIQSRVLRQAAMLSGDNPDDPKVIQKYRAEFLSADTNGSSPPPSMGPSTDGFNDKPDPETSQFWENAARQGVPYGQALDIWKKQVEASGRQVSLPPPPDGYAKIAAFMAAHPNQEYHPYSATTRTPNTSRQEMTTGAVGGAMMTPAGTFAANAANGAAAGIPMGLAGDQGQYAQAMMQSQSPNAALAGDIFGSTAGMLTGEGSLARAGMQAGLKRELAANGLYGAVRGAADNPDDRIGGAFMGGASAAAGTLGGNALVRGGSSVLRGVADPSVNALFGAGVNDMTLGQIVSRSGRTGSVIKGVEDRLAGFPGVGDVINARRAESVRQFNSASFDHALKPIGAKIDGATGEEAVAKASDAVSQAFNDALKGKAVTPDDKFIRQARGPLERLANNKRVGPEIVDAIEQATSGLFDQNTGTLTGEHMQAFLQGLRQIRQGYRNDPLYATLIKPSIQGIENSVEGMFARQAPEVMPKYNAAKNAYRRVSTLADAVNRGKQTEGVFSPAQLGMADRANAKKYDGAISAASGNSPFFDLQRAGQNVLPNKIPDSGTAGRAAMLLAPGGLTAAGGVAGYASGDAKSGAEAGLGLSALLALAYTRAGQQRLAKLLLSRSPRTRAAAERILKLAAPVNATGAAVTESTLGQ